MTRKSRLAAVVRDYIEQPPRDFSEAALRAGLNPACDFMRAFWEGASFRGADLRKRSGGGGLGFAALGSVALGEFGQTIPAFDFTGARLLNCDFTGARIAGARFDQAEIDRAVPDARLDPKRTNLRAAADWGEHLKSWRRPEEIPDDSHLPVGAIFQDAPFGPELVVVPSGTFTIGTSPEEMAALEKENGAEYGKLVKWEGPQREITIAHRLAVGRFPVMFQEWDTAQDHPDWQRLAERPPRRPDDRKWGRGRRPVIDVNWDDAQAYARWLAGVTGQPYRLLTEAEWEYCCRAGKSTRYCNGDDASRLGEVAWFGENSDGKTKPVGEKASNAWGLYDMHGNVWEWCEDAFVDSYDNLPDDGSAQKGREQNTVSRVLRGGSWYSIPQDLRSAFRNHFQPVNRYGSLGFRLARTLSP